MRALTLAIVIAIIRLGAGRAHAATFQVAPTQVALAGDHHTAAVKVINHGRSAVRFQVKAMAWTEDEDGAMTLVPTEDLVVYPTLFTVAPGASQAVRLASMATPGDREIAYRIFVEELPAPRRADSLVPGHITMRTRMGVPVFLPPAKVAFAGDVTAQLASGELEISLHNRGSAHVRVASVRVAGERAGGPAFSRRQAGWYLLAGGARRYRMKLAASDCAGLTAVRVVVDTDHGTWRGALQVPAGACAGVR